MRIVSPALRPYQLKHIPCLNVDPTTFDIGHLAYGHDLIVSVKIIVRNCSLKLISGDFQ